jgi:putative addiction module killer protein
MSALEQLVTFMLPSFMLELRYYLTETGDSPFARWFGLLDPVARARVATALARIEQGNFSNIKPVGQGVLEYRIDFGPGYRVYLGRDGDILVILLKGGTKKRQQRDIRTAVDLWRTYKQSKRVKR